MNTKQHEQAPLTSRQRQVLQFVASFIGDNGYPPSQREICKFLGVPGNRPAVKHLAALEQKGYLKRDHVSRGIVLTTPINRSVSLPIAGIVRAGQLTPAVEDIRGYFSVDQLAVKGEGCFFLTVSGDSMIEAGIVEGDLALVRPQVTAENGDTIVAMVNGEATLKKIFREADHIRLQPANATMKPIIIRPEAGDVAIVGKVIGVYRRLE